MARELGLLLDVVLEPLGHHGCGSYGYPVTIVAGLPDSKRAWWRRSWVPPLAVAVAAFLAFSLPPYLTLDPAKARVAAPEGFPEHYPLLVAHVLFASVAMVASLPQVWPWFRGRFPSAHKVIGRVYVFGGVLPAGLSGLVIGALSPFGPVARVSNVMLALLWLAFTVTAWRRARQRRFVEHRKWMIRSFALTFSILVNRIVGAILIVVLSPQLDTTFGGDETYMVNTLAGIGTTLSLLLVLLFTQWWLERPEHAKLKARAAG